MEINLKGLIMSLVELSLWFMIPFVIVGALVGLLGIMGF